MLASRANALCDVWRDEIAGVPTKSYQCTVSEGQVLTTTFMRLSDVMFDSAGGAPLDGPAGEYQSLVRGHRLIETPALETFSRLFETHSFAFEPSNLEVEFDMRGQGLSGREDLSGAGTEGRRWRTLGVWDETLGLFMPAFPLPAVLRRAIENRSGVAGPRFLRHATAEDFRDLDAKRQEYVRLWGANVEDRADLLSFGNLDMLADIEAGSVEGFLPLLFHAGFGQDGCSGAARGGALYVPPALYVDVAVCRNDGAEPAEIEDMFGAAETTTRLRPYDPATPPREERFGWRPVTLAPGESLLAVQRLIFGARPTTLDEETIPATRAVYGPTHLPKGVIVKGQPVAFDGRSHNAVILASYANCCSCPYLESWCPRAEEWIDHGKVLAECDAPERAGSETRHFRDARCRFRISEREHEDTTLTAARLDVTLDDGTTRVFELLDAPRRLTIGESCELAVELPPGIARRARSSALTLWGHYEKFTQARFEARSLALTT
ncbi:hypothetical protein Salmuc_03942 [Salipiger mucosus DSM 16094]|uniref:Uncharacterized protein n=1 Tax=Salipiger mucosus DSM 16094 TaxID=1123237 RepID=S9QAC2_9RHOB|nr:hypothetical protein Salmuc_03942 [Salipiger mucosus DSM 16094]